MRQTIQKKNNRPVEETHPISLRNPAKEQEAETDEDAYIPNKQRNNITRSNKK
jgi:hypothetical protein